MKKHSEYNLNHKQNFDQYWVNKLSWKIDWKLCKPKTVRTRHPASSENSTSKTWKNHSPVLQSFQIVNDQWGQLLFEAFPCTLLEQWIVAVSILQTILHHCMGFLPRRMVFLKGKVCSRGSTIDIPSAFSKCLIPLGKGVQLYFQT